MTRDEQRDVQDYLKEEAQLREEGKTEEADKVRDKRLRIINQYPYDED